MKSVVFGLAIFFVVFMLMSYSQQIVICPYCHNSDANTKGRCVLRQQTGHCSEDYYDEHHNLSTCSWCASEGRMTRLEAFMD